MSCHKMSIVRLDPPYPFICCICCGRQQGRQTMIHSIKLQPLLSRDAMESFQGYINLAKNHTLRPRWYLQVEHAKDSRLPLTQSSSQWLSSIHNYSFSLLWALGSLVMDG